MNRTFLHFLALLTSCLLVVNGVISQNDTQLMPYLKGNLYGFANSKGKVVIKPKYESVSLFENGFSRIRLENKWGILKENGQELLAPIAQMVSPFDQNGLSIVKVEGKYGVLNTKGDWLVPLEYSWLSIKNGFIQVTNSERQAALLDLNGKTVVDFEYSQFEFQFHEDSVLDPNHIVVIKNNQYGLICIYKGKVTVKIAPQFQSLKLLGNGLVQSEKARKLGLMNIEGETVLPFVYDDFKKEGEFIIAEQEIEYEIKVKVLEPDGYWHSIRGYYEIDKEFDDENRIVYYLLTQEEHERMKSYGPLDPYRRSMFSVINKQGEVIIPAQGGYIDIDTYFIKASTDESFLEREVTLYTKHGEKVGSTPFISVEDTHEGLVLATTFSEETEFLSNDQRSEEEKKIDFLNRFKTWFMDSSGAWVLPPIYNGARSFSQQRAPVRKDNKWALINRKGELLTEFKYDQLLDAGENRYAFLMGKRWGLMDLNGNEIIPATYYAYRETYYETDYYHGYSVAGLLFKNGKALTSKEIPGFSGSRTTMIDTNGVQLFPFKYQSIEEQVGGLFKVSLKYHNRDYESYGLIDSLGNVLIPVNQDYISWLEREQLFVASTNANKHEHVYYDINGRMVDSPFKEIEREGLREYQSLSNGYYSAKLGHLTVYFTPEGIPLFEDAP